MPIELHSGMSPYYSQYSNHTITISDPGHEFRITLRNPDIEMIYNRDGENHINITGRIQTSVPGERIVIYPSGATEFTRITPYREKTAVFPGSITLADANGATIEMQPTGTGGYTLHAPEPVRINSKMNEALREHASRCLAYHKPKPAAELES